eukprot:3795301-Rhodomonas_salina.2
MVRRKCECCCTPSSRLSRHRAGESDGSSERAFSPSVPHIALRMRGRMGCRVCAADWLWSRPDVANEGRLVHVSCNLNNFSTFVGMPGSGSHPLPCASSDRADPYIRWQAQDSGRLRSDRHPHCSYRGDVAGLLFCRA